MPTATPRRDIGAEIRAEMGRQRISMLGLSRLTGIARTTLVDQINGGGRITVDNLVKIAGALKVDASDLMGEAVA